MALFVISRILEIGQDTQKNPVLCSLKPCSLSSKKSSTLVESIKSEVFWGQPQANFSPNRTLYLTPIYLIWLLSTWTRTVIFSLDPSKSFSAMIHLTIKIIMFLQDLALVPTSPRPLHFIVIASIHLFKKNKFIKHLLSLPASWSKYCLYHC